MATNGKLSDAELSPIFNGAGPRVQLSNSAAAAWNSLALHKDTVMRVKGTVSAYRNYASQEHFWKLYQAGKGNLAAKPGKSNHGWGNAADVPPETEASIRSATTARRFMAVRRYAEGRRFPATVPGPTTQEESGAGPSNLGAWSVR